MVARVRGIRAKLVAIRATQAPIESSHIRVVETKNARSGDVAVSIIEQAKDGTATTKRPIHKIGRTFLVGSSSLQRSRQ